jgi:hypothetical protein
MKHLGRVEPVPGGLIELGPLIDVVLAPHPAIQAEHRSAGRAVPSATVKLMVDTGAQKTIVEMNLAQGLGLLPIRFEQMVGVSQKAESCPVYLMSISMNVREGHILNHATFHSEIVGMNSPAQPQKHAGLLGRDFLSHVKFIYRGPAGRFDLDFSNKGKKRRR